MFDIYYKMLYTYQTEIIRSYNMIQKAIKFLTEVIAELKKVSWSGRKEVIGSTAVVITLIAIVAAFTGFIDFILSRVLAVLIK